jgi:hypothetical protein
MTNEERKPIVRDLLRQGRSLSEILDFLHREKQDTITYMELRLLLSEMPDAKLPEKEPPKPAAVTTDSTVVKTAPPGKGAEPASKLSIGVDQMPQPGSMLSGFVRFASGAKAHWFLDEMGRLGLEPELGSEKPTQQDMKEFTTELRKMLQQAGGM